MKNTTRFKDTSQKPGKKRSLFAQQFSQRSLSDFGMKVQKSLVTSSDPQNTQKMIQGVKHGTCSCLYNRTGCIEAVRGPFTLSDCESEREIFL